MIKNLRTQPYAPKWEQEEEKKETQSISFHNSPYEENTSSPRKSFSLSRNKVLEHVQNMGHFNKPLDSSMCYIAICTKVSFIEFN
jgi:hypothetical protein